ncbi:MULTISPECIES: phycoerythrobilin:ferredoxin oxidoreductase [unclassified Okeania]|uniref:phycoerythrobilin:ferredoxin oxidoreductase n=1 Tax=unclassified Okeania TaxID=2634635 RepID=UPI0013BB77C2|nr:MULTISPECIES: phycoerythrobilin:ferredoxin oxidoreductase [unclassified Okeania]NEP06647.1 phycoerythrobilin:ferredoxin oxidoreductase [Okeania sp. SIO4D6]NEP71826.1 phycoerythrobilin:ferredoxin oxidoreductase [Okeania sp. SIO2G5]NEP92846.1 phycoerythrobilin:ferredoxin oxidoreductase [Okeania sp. SIO2F5]NEQ90923.1 phycoerythrobilin:ferredoxin oxidoreductase [Okeania sp. SIO2G4]NES90726.1 phycoerythrobilin:ferredoxin oxidoreductase [Okeania sp. SIO2B9]
MTPTENIVNLYQPFLDYALTQLKQELELKPYPIPSGFEHKVAITGKGKKEQEVDTTSYAYCSPKLRQIRAAHVQGGSALQVLNFVIFPHLNYDLPFFGADLVTLPGGHLIALDMQPLFRDDPQYQEKYTQPIWDTFQTHQQHLPWGGDFPEEATPFFSPAFLWTRPQKNELVETRVFEAFKDYLQAYLIFVKQAQPITDVEKLAEIKQAQLRYLRYRAEKDPARGMFTRFYGPEWTEEYIHGFLFDLERQLALNPV